MRQPRSLIEPIKSSLHAWRAASLTPLERPQFRTIWTASLVSNIGAAIQTVGAAWTMTTLVESPQLVALVQTAAMLPIVLLALPSGALADTIDRRKLMLVSQVLGFAAAAALAVIAYAGVMSPISLLACTAMVGAAVALYQPAWQASLADFVPRTELPAAVALNALAFNTARSVGPAIGGAVIAVFGPAMTFVLNAASFTGLIAVLTRTRLPAATSSLPPERVSQAIAGGLRYVGMSPPLQRTYIRGALFGFGASALWSLMPLVAQSRLGGGPISYGLLMGSFGFGSLSAALLAAHLRALLGNDRLVAMATAAFAASTAVAGLSPFAGLTVPFMLIAGASWIFIFTTTRTCTQLCSPRWVVGRTISLAQVAGFGCMAIGAAFWGGLAAQIGLVAALLAAAVYLAATLIAVRLAPLPAANVDDYSPHGGPIGQPPQTAIDGRLGPIVVTIQYSVPADKQAEFTALMQELGQMRRRNGAARWSLRQDIDDPSTWFEQIESASWVDHVRRIERNTVADAQLNERAAAYRASAPNAIRRMAVRPPGSEPLR
ncbi:MAG: MFS transporter [Maricaulaceae bacterium]|jgi:MFS family permease